MIQLVEDPPSQALHSHSFIDLPEREGWPGVSSPKGAAKDSSEGANLLVGMDRYASDALICLQQEIVS